MPEPDAQGGRPEGGDMSRRNQMLISAALLVACAVPASSAMADQVVQSPDARDAAEHRGLYEVDRAQQSLSRNYGSPDAADAANHRGLYELSRGPYALDREYGSPDAADAARDLPAVRIPAPTVEVREPSGGFDWGDAGIGAAGMLALLSLAAGSALLVSTRRRRRGFQAVTH
jgi:hypothetical protein